MATIARIQTLQNPTYIPCQGPVGSSKTLDKTAATANSTKITEIRNFARFPILSDTAILSLLEMLIIKGLFLPKLVGMQQTEGKHGVRAEPSWLQASKTS